jgi:pentapeptide repeat protein
MIVVSLLLILVAVVLLVLGLAGGSSMLLISSIGASLLAAVALVIGARRSAAARRAAMARAVPVDGDDRPTVVNERATAGSASREGRRQADPSAFADDPPAQDEGLASSGAAQARGANRDDAEEALVADAAYREAAVPDPADTYDPGVDPAGADLAGADLTGADLTGADLTGADLTDPAEHAWRREHGADTVPRADEPLLPDGPQRPTDDGSRFDAFASGQPGGGFSGDSTGRSEGSDGFSDSSGPAEEFGDPDEDDPADEPLPQAIRPADAVRVARMTAEVLVVDGRPRYHVADCPHLVGRLTEPLPVAEAVELGFSPCGLCRPIDRLVAQAARR